MSWVIDYNAYKHALDDLKQNSKPLITNLTKLAETKIKNAPYIVRAIEERIIEAPFNQKLPALYVLDSIVKNLLSSEYIELFQTRLPFVFANVFTKTDEQTRAAMYKLRKTWTPFFSSSTLNQLDREIKKIDPAWPITVKVSEQSDNFIQSPVHKSEALVASTINGQENSATHHSLFDGQMQEMRKKAAHLLNSAQITMKKKRKRHISALSQTDLLNQGIDVIEEEDGDEANTVPQQKTSNITVSIADSTSDSATMDVMELFGHTDRDYRHFKQHSSPTTPNKNTEVLRNDLIVYDNAIGYHAMGRLNTTNAALQEQTLINKFNDLIHNPFSPLLHPNTFLLPPSILLPSLPPQQVATPFPQAEQTFLPPQSTVILDQAINTKTILLTSSDVSTKSDGEKHQIPSSGILPLASTVQTTSPSLDATIHQLFQNDPVIVKRLQTFFDHIHQRELERLRSNLPPITTRLSHDPKESIIEIDGKTYGVRLNHSHCITLYGQKYDFYCDLPSKQIRINNKHVFTMGDKERRVKLPDSGGRDILMMYMGRQVDVWLDSYPYELRTDTPPKYLNMNNRHIRIQIDSSKNEIYINDRYVANLDDQPRLIQVTHQDNSTTQHEIRFTPPPKTIMIDSQPKTMRYDLKFPCIEIDGKFFGIRFTGPPREIYVDNVAHRVPFDSCSTRIHLGKRAHEIAWGGPGFEVIIDGRPYEIHFDQLPREIYIGGRPHSISIHGQPPEVKILDELPFLDTKGGVGALTALVQLFSSRQQTLNIQEIEMFLNLLRSGLLTPDDTTLLFSNNDDNSRRDRGSRQSPKRSHDDDQGFDDENGDRKRMKSSAKFDEDNYAPVPDLTEANVTMLKKKYVGIVQQLYLGVFQCRLCGLRYTSKQKLLYTHHLDWHYRENRQEKELGTSSSSLLLQRSRDWYCTLQEWTEYEETIEEKEMIVTNTNDGMDDLFFDDSLILQQKVLSCAANNDEDRCCVCGDQFQNFFNDNRDEWHLRDAVRVDGKTYHPICYQDVKAENSSGDSGKTGVLHFSIRLQFQSDYKGVTICQIIFGHVCTLCQDVNQIAVRFLYDDLPKYREYHVESNDRKSHLLSRTNLVRVCGTIIASSPVLPYTRGMKYICKSVFCQLNNRNRSQYDLYDIKPFDEDNEREILCKGCDCILTEVVNERWMSEKTLVLLEIHDPVQSLLALNHLEADTLMTKRHTIIIRTHIQLAHHCTHLKTGLLLSLVSSKLHILAVGSESRIGDILLQTALKYAHYSVEHHTQFPLILAPLSKKIKSPFIVSAGSIALGSDGITYLNSLDKLTKPQLKQLLAESETLTIEVNKSEQAKKFVYSIPLCTNIWAYHDSRLWLSSEKLSTPTNDIPPAIATAFSLVLPIDEIEQDYENIIDNYLEEKLENCDKDKQFDKEIVELIDDLKMFLNHIRMMEMYVSEEAEILLKKYFCACRRTGRTLWSTTELPATTTEVLTQLCESVAKCNLHNEAIESDVIQAIYMFEISTMTRLGSSYPNGNVNGETHIPNGLHSVYDDASLHSNLAYSDLPSYITANGHTSGINKMDPDTGAFVAVGTAGNANFDLRSLGLTEQELYSAGLHQSNFDPAITQGQQLPLNQYKINYDPNPIVIKKQMPIEQPTYKQQIIVRYLRPPTPPAPGPLVIKEVRPPPPAPAPPLIIRTRAPRGKTPPPIIIREQPPIAPQVDTQSRYITKMLPPELSSSQRYMYEQQPSQELHYNNAYQTVSDPSYISGNFENLSLGGNQFNNDSLLYGNTTNKNWITEVVDEEGKRNPIHQSMLDDVYKAMNNRLPRV
ncbi:unnamed protein product [Didymodactylos carnosus]|uniref:CID domain-containing protein n=1 Tax=Didymodactylos carnosus TaxID=1234261 RepID=A0A8S2H5Z5_9BILA|nr:unnamed protein product [Didymodactylos carnosus]CAF3582952.1 unnamed protein product [Didymodactylos carnosus]